MKTQTAVKQSRPPREDGKVNVPLNVSEEFRDELDIAARESENMSRNAYMARVLAIAVERKWRFKRGARTLLNESGEAETQGLLRDIHQVAYYEDSSIEGGLTSGTFAENPPGRIEVPSSWKLPVDFVVKVHGISMRGVIDDGELAAFVRASRAANGQVVAALKDGQILVKLYNDIGDGQPELLSINAEYAPIPCTDDVVIQGVFQGPFPPPSKHKKTAA